MVCQWHSALEGAWACRKKKKTEYVYLKGRVMEKNGEGGEEKFFSWAGLLFKCLKHRVDQAESRRQELLSGHLLE